MARGGPAGPARGRSPQAPATGGARKHMLKQPFFTTGCGAEPRKKILP